MESSRGDSKADSKPEANQNGLIPIEAIAQQGKWRERITQEIVVATAIPQNVVGIVVSYFSLYDLGKWTYNISLDHRIDEMMKEVEKARLEKKNVDAVYQSFGLNNYSEKKDDEALEEIKKEQANNRFRLLAIAAQNGHIKTLHYFFTSSKPSECAAFYSGGYYTRGNNCRVSTTVLLESMMAGHRPISIWMLENYNTWSVIDAYRINSQGLKSAHYMPKSHYKSNPLITCVERGDIDLAFGLLSYGANPFINWNMKDIICPAQAAMDKKNDRMLALFSFFNENVRVHVEEKIHKNDVLKRCKSELEMLFNKDYLSPEKKKDQPALICCHRERATKVLEALSQSNSFENMLAIIRVQINAMKGEPSDQKDLNQLPKELTARWTDPKKVSNKLDKEDKDSFYGVLFLAGGVVRFYQSEPVRRVQWWAGR